MPGLKPLRTKSVVQLKALKPIEVSRGQKERDGWACKRESERESVCVRVSEKVREREREKESFFQTTSY